MKLFEPGAKHATAQSRRIFAIYEIVYTCVDFGAALTFIIGSIMFFSDAWQIPGTWMFLVGSILFAVKPTLRLVREVHLYRHGEAAKLAQRLGGRG
ncbi:YrhK family protein [Albimonas sp. CAU 1670]|uniref:YrhK family protein n=1 Tax=Albimonas sp. CAU 1670 TaxID=3032599 RepID=UPI0023DC60AB|nr:YrhK family protein [Albimonas sp. CAU 1670]MDF2232739.1 YrhK family protein [Albimonas sp. CAU 1670]